MKAVVEMADGDDVQVQRSGRSRRRPPPTWQWLLALVVILVVGMVVFRVEESHTTSATDTSACSPDPSPAIAALPPGGTLIGVGCYVVPNGLVVTKPVTIDGGTYIDPTSVKVPRVPFGPVILVEGTSDVSLENLHVIGGNPSGRYVPSLVGQAGIELKNTSAVSIRDVTVDGTFGDGLELWAHAPRDMTPNTGVTVDGLTITAAGRNGISPSDVLGATFTGVHIVSWGLTAVDFESDMANVGAGDVTFTDSSWGGTYIQETITGPLTFERCTLVGKIQVVVRYPTSPPVVFRDGSLSIGTKANNVGVVVRGPVSVTFADESFTRPPRRDGHAQTKPMWQAVRGAQLTFARSILVPPLGTADAASTVTVTP